MDKTSDLNPNRTRAALDAHSDEGMKISGNRHIEDIRAEIDKTRQETTRTINELESRLSLSRLIAQVKGRARQAASGRVDAMAIDTDETKRWGTAFYDTIKNNPIPTMLLGGGLAWLIASGIRREEGSQNPETGFVERRNRIGTDETGTYGLGFIDRRRSAASRTADQTREKAAQKASRIKSDVQARAGEAREKAAQWSGQMRAKASQTKTKAQELSSSAVEYGRRAQERLARSGKSAREGFFRSMDSSPLALAGVVMAAGAVLGLIVPETHYEEEKMGSQREEVLARARAAGREKMEQVEAVARESMQSAKESAEKEAERQGLVTRDTAEEAEQTAKDVAQEAQSQAEEKGAE